MKYSIKHYNFEWDGGPRMGVYLNTGEHLFDHDMIRISYPGGRLEPSFDPIPFTLENMKKAAAEAEELVCFEDFWPHMEALEESGEID